MAQAEADTWAHKAHGNGSSIRAALRHALSGRRVAVVGDSMARGSFETLVAMLRGSDIVVSARSTNWKVISSSYVQARVEGGLIIDSLAPKGALHRELVASRNATPWQSQAAALPDKWPLANHLWLHGAGAAEKQQAALRIDFVDLGCFDEGPGVHKFLTAGRWRQIMLDFDVVVIHTPAYHPLLNMCRPSSNHRIGEGNRSSALLGELVAPASAGRGGAVGAFWERVRAAAANATRGARPKLHVVAVNAPTENIGTYRTVFNHAHGEEGRITQQIMNQHLEALVGTFPDDGTWSHVDWASEMRARTPPTMAPGNWHYTCQGFTMDARTWRVMVRTNGDCREEGNTVLWGQLVLPHLQHATRTVSPARLA